MWVCVTSIGWSFSEILTTNTVWVRERDGKLLKTLEKNFFFENPVYGLPLSYNAFKLVTLAVRVSSSTCLARQFLAISWVGWHSCTYYPRGRIRYSQLSLFYLRLYFNMCYEDYIIHSEANHWLSSLLFLFLFCSPRIKIEQIISYQLDAWCSGYDSLVRPLFGLLAGGLHPDHHPGADLPHPHQICCRHLPDCKLEFDPVAGGFGHPTASLLQQQGKQGPAGGRLRQAGHQPRQVLDALHLSLPQDYLICFGNERWRLCCAKNEWAISY